MGGADPTLDDGRYLLAWLERTEVEYFTRRELFTALPRGRFAKVDALDPSLALLVEHGYIRPLPPPERCSGPGRPASPGFEVNPLWRRELSAKSAVSAEPTATRLSAYCADSADDFGRFAQ